MKKLLTLSLALCVGASQAALFDFELSAPQVVPSIVLANGGVGLTITRTGIESVELVALDPPFNTTPFQGRSLFHGGVSSDYRFQFSQVLQSVSIQFGDFGGDSDVIRVAAFHNGNQVDTQDINIGSSSLFVNPPNQYSYSGQVDELRAGVIGQSGVYFDNIVATPVPEPATFAALGVGIAALMRKRRRIAA